MIGIDVINGPQFVAGMRQRAERLSNDLETISKKTANDIYADAMRNTPSRKGGGGGLRSGWDKQNTGKWEYVVKNPVKYAMHVEKGFTLTKAGLRAMGAQGLLKNAPKKGKGVPRQIPGRHMLGNAVHRADPQMKQAVRQALTRASR